MFYLELEGPNSERWETFLNQLCQGLDTGMDAQPGAGTMISLGEKEESEWYRNKTLHNSMCHARQVKMLKIPPLLSPEKLC